MKSVVALVALFAVAQASVVVHQRLGGNFAYSVNGAVPVVAPYAAAPYAYPYTYVAKPAEVKEVKPVEVKASPLVYTYPHYPYAYAPLPVEVKEAPKVEVKATPLVYSYAPFAPYGYGYPYGYPVLPAVSAPKVEEAKPAEPAADAEVVDA